VDPGRRRIFRGLALLLAAVAVVFAILGYRDGRGGRRVFAERMINHENDFDFGDPPCVPASKPDADIRVAYLGVGGLLIEWRGSTLVAAPYYTRQGFFDVWFGEVHVDSDAIARGVEAFEPANWDILLSGHSHYDHLADVPELMTRHARKAELWSTRSGANILAAFPEIEHRVHPIDDLIDSWILPVLDGDPLPYRIMPLASDHAPHLYGESFADGSVKERWSSWDGRKVSSMLDGLTVSFLIDLLDEETTVFRIFYQDSVSPAGAGHPSAKWIDERPADLAVLCIPPYWQVEDYPEGSLESTRAGYVLAIHYEDFFRPAERPLRFVRSLTDARVDRMLERIENVTRDRVGATPMTPICGPSGERWSMPLPGEWLGFDIPEYAVLTSPAP
jgi:hypothetical protein